MQFKSPSQFSFTAIVLSASVLIVICIFTIVQPAEPTLSVIDTHKRFVVDPAEPRLSVNDSHKRFVIIPNVARVAPVYLGGTEQQRASPSFLLSSERARELFLKKVDNEILKGRDPSTIPASGSIDGGWFGLWNVFTTIYSCPHVLNRIGTLKDCGKWTCGLDVFERTKEDPCVIYSFGVGEDSTFEVEMVNRTGCNVYAFDHTLKNGMTLPSDLDQRLAERIHFSNVGIGSKAQVKSNPKLRTLKELMDKNGHDWIDFLKMDIEYDEFPVLKDVAEDFPTFPFGHLNLEVHLEKGRATAFGRMYDLWAMLERKGLRAFFSEPNLRTVFQGTPYFQEFSFINVVDSKSRLLRF